MIITKEDIENKLMVDIDPVFDSQINSWISAVQKYIETYIDRQIIRDTTATTRLFDGRGIPSLLIDDCNDVESVSQDDSLLDADAFVAFPYNSPVKWQIRAKNGVFASGFANIGVKAKWGMYTEETIPDDLRLAATILAVGILNSAKNPAGGAEVKSESIGRYTVSYVTTAEREQYMTAKSILDSYRRMTV